jgi:hypothetical protein
MPMIDSNTAYLLISRSGPPRRNLAVWSAQLAKTLSNLDLSDRSPAAVGRLIGTTSEAALVTTHRGDYESAAGICDSQLAYLRRHPASRDFAIARHALNPWLNLGRLASLSGRTSDACNAFAIFRNCQTVVALAGITLNLTELNARLRTEKGYPNFCAHLYVGNSLRALVRSGAWPALVAFTQSCDGVEPPMRPIVDEARIIASIQLGKPAEALEVASAYRNAPKMHVKLTFRVRELEILGRLGQRVERESWSELEEGLGEMMNALSSAGSLALGLHLAEAALAQGQRATAERLGRRCLDAAQLLADEIYTHSALYLLSRCSAEPGAAKYRGAAATIADTSEYASISSNGYRRAIECPKLVAAACGALA